MARLARAAAQALLLEDGIDTRPSPLSPSALEVLSHPRRIQHCAAYTGGAVELQDAASQAVADAVPVTDGQRVLDFCAGGGGKSLALAARCPGIWVAAHDVDPNRMSDLPARAARAGAEILRIAPQDIDRHRNFDVVVVDAPCSGSGAWRRAPQGKWALTPQRLEEVQRLQDTILARASGHVRPGGVLAYMTCSVLECENGARVSRFLAEHPAWRLRSMTRLTPLDGGDGFFLALLDRSVTISDGPANTAAQ